MENLVEELLMVFQDDSKASDNEIQLFSQTLLRCRIVISWKVKYLCRIKVHKSTNSCISTTCPKYFNNG